MTRQTSRSLFTRCTILLVTALLLRCIPTWYSLLRPTHSNLQPAAPSSTVQEFSDPVVQSSGLPPLRFRDVPEANVPATPQERISFSAEDAALLRIHGNCTLSYDSTSLLLAPQDMQTTTEGPQLLIVHTHSTEAYQPETGWEYEETEPFRTLDPEHSVIRLGTEIAAILEDAGISVIHDTTINDYPSYSGSYDRMEAIIQDYLETYPSIRMVLDVHRDAFEEADGSMGRTTENGQARVMLVTGTNQGGLYHPNWESNLSFALKLEVLLQKTVPGLSRGISLCTQRYNQHLTPHSLLAEFGAAGDTLQEAIAAARVFAPCLAELLQQTHF